MARKQRNLAKTAAASAATALVEEAIQAASHIALLHGSMAP
jgi:hypothetical protein